jgi:hypothetical protein
LLSSFNSQQKRDRYLLDIGPLGHPVILANLWGLN